MSRRRVFVLSTLLVGMGVALGSVLSVAIGRAQTALDDEAQLEQERARLYDSLEGEALELEKHAKALKTIAKVVGPAVVHIDAEMQNSTRSARYNGMVEDTGSGVLIQLGEQFYVLTNRHVVKDHELANIKIKLHDNREITPTKELDDPDTDVAVMAVSAPGLVAARVGDSEKVEIGDFVLAMGSPFGLSRSVTLGIISAKGRRDLSLADRVRYQDFLQTDAAINPGNSGGPLINLRGEVVGINTAIASNSGGSQGIGFSIPINMAMNVARQLIQRGRIDRAYLGVHLDGNFGQDTANRLRMSRPRGARVTGLTPRSPAANALQVDDVIIEFAGKNVDDDAHLVNIVGAVDVGKSVPVVVWRDGRPVELQVKVGNKTDFPTAPLSEAPSR